jgi:hypothetical protein
MWSLRFFPVNREILADTVVRAADLYEAKRRAEDVLVKHAGEMDLATAEAELVQAIAQLQAINKMRNVVVHQAGLEHESCENPKDLKTG